MEWRVVGNEDAQYEAPDDVLGLPVPWGYKMKVEGDGDSRVVFFQHKYETQSKHLKFPTTDGCIYDDLVYGSAHLEVKENDGNEWRPLMEVRGLRVPNDAVIVFRCVIGKYLSRWVFSACIDDYWTRWPECHDTDTVKRQFRFGTDVPFAYEMFVDRNQMSVEFKLKSEFRLPPAHMNPMYHGPLSTREFPPTRPCLTTVGKGYLYVQSYSTGYKDVPLFQPERTELLIARHGEPVKVYIQTDSIEPKLPGPSGAFCISGILSDPTLSMRACSKSQGKSGLTYTTSTTRGQFLPIKQEQRKHMNIFAVHGESVLLRIKTADFQIDSPPAYCNNGGLSFATRSERPCITTQGLGRHLYVRSATLGQENVLLMQTRHVIIALHGEPVTMGCDRRLTAQLGLGQGRCENGKIVPLPKCLRHCQAFIPGRNVAIIRVAAIWDEPNEAKVTFRDYPEQIRHGARYSVRCSHENQFFDFPYIECNNGTWFGSSEEIITGKTETAPLSDFAGPLSVRCRPQSAGRSGGGRGRGGRGGRGGGGVAIGPGIDDLD